MGNRVGTKGQVVIEKEIRERLGVEPGALAIQRLVGDRVEITFLPPVRRSLKGAARPFMNRSTEAEDRAAEAAWTEAAADKERRVQRQLAARQRRRGRPEQREGRSG